MRNKLIALLATTALLSGISTSAWASQFPSPIVSTANSTSTGQIDLPKSAIDAIAHSKTREFISEEGHFIALGSSYFELKTNQGLRLETTQGACTTDSNGCWSTALGSYVPIFIDEEKLVAYQSSHNYSDAHHFRRASGWDVTLGAIGIAAAIGAGVLLVAMTPVTVPVAVVTVATVVTRSATVAGGAVAACRGLFNGCR